MDGHKALIIFARLPKPGQVKTRLGEKLGMERASEVYASFARHALGLGESVNGVGVKVYLFYDPIASGEEVQAWVNHPFIFLPQEGTDLGERMKNAFEQTFSDGAGSTVIIGTDVPDLNETIIQNAFNHLEAHDAVIGPSTDGGYYLLGMKAPGRNLFDGVQWSTGSVFGETLTRLHELQASYFILETLTDIDTFEDYEEYLRRARNFW